MTFRPVPMVGGRSWHFEHGGNHFEILTWNGLDKVSLFYRGSGEHRHTRHTNGLGARGVALDIYSDVINGNGRA